MYEITLLASTLIYVGVLFWFLSRPFSSIFHPIFFYLGFHGLVFVVRPIFSYKLKYQFIYKIYQFHPDIGVKSAVLAASTLGLLCFVSGASRSGSEKLEFKQGFAALQHRRELVRPLLFSIMLLFPVAFYSLLTVFFNGYAGLRLDVHTGTAINTTGNGWLYEAQLMLVPLTVIVAWAFRFRWWSLLPLLLFVTVRAGTGGRGPFVVACVAVGMLWLFDHKRRWPTARMFALALPLLVVFYFVGQERGVVRQVLETGTVVTYEKKTGFMESMDFANLEFFEYLVNTVPTKTGTYGYFVDNLQVLTEPIPRAWWPGKPVGPPIRMFNLFDYGNPVGMTYSLPGYGWMQGGYLGVALWCALWGYALGAVYSRFARSKQGNFATAAYFAFLPIFIIAYRDGGLLTILRTGVFYLTPVGVWWWAARLLKIPDPAELARRAARRMRRTEAGPGAPAMPGARPNTPGIPDTAPPPRSRRAPEAIVPRAWRARPSLPPSR